MTGHSAERLEVVFTVKGWITRSTHAKRNDVVNVPLVSVVKFSGAFSAAAVIAKQHAKLNAIRYWRVICGPYPFWE
jgi:hypothetical protein